MSGEAHVDNLFKLFNLLQDLMAQHMIIDETVKEVSGSESSLDLESLESAATVVISICEEIEKDLSPNQKKCCCA